MQNQQNLISSPKESQRLALSESKESRLKVDELLGACLALQKLYGRDVANAGTIIDVFQNMMAKYPADKVIRAFEAWMERSQEFPTPADIINLIKRNGKPPLKESDIIAIRKKEVCEWTRSEGAMVEEWEAQQKDGWTECRDPVKEDATLQENIRLRSEVAELRKEARHLTELLHDARTTKGLEKPEPPVEDKVKNTIAAMRSAGAPQADIDEFGRQYGIQPDAA